MADLLAEIWCEYSRASRLNKPFNTPHEGIAVIKEEFDELWDEIKKKRKKRSLKKMRREATHLGAMAVRFIIDCCSEEGKADV
jgi:hypothetical protein